MRAKPSTRLQKLIEQCPAVEDVLGWYGIILGRDADDLTVSEACKIYHLDLEDILVELQDVIDEEDEDEEDEDEEDEDEDEDDLDEEDENDFDEEDDLDGFEDSDDEDLDEDDDD